MGATDQRYADKIAKLLRKAENPAVGQAEAEAFIAKAQELMTQYAIDEALIAKARGATVAEKIIEDTTTYTGIYHQALFDIGAAIARAQDCKVLISKRSNKTTLYIVGFESDVARAKMLDTSVQIQAAGAMRKWWNEAKDEYAWYSDAEKFRTRRSFFFGFASGLSAKLSEAKAAGKQAAKNAEAERVGNIAEAEASVELVVRDRKSQVQDWYDKRYGRARKGVARNYANGGPGAGAAGAAAGRRADLGGGKVNRGGGGALNA